MGGEGLVPHAPAYAATRAAAVAWALAYPLRNMAWQGMWEDMPVTDTVGANLNCFAASEAAAYLLDKREAVAPDWLNMTSVLLDWLWDVFVVEFSDASQPPIQWGAPVLAEQTFDKARAPSSSQCLKPEHTHTHTHSQMPRSLSPHNSNSCL